RNVEGGDELLGGDRLAEPCGQGQAAHAEAAEGQEIATLHAGISGSWARRHRRGTGPGSVNGPDRIVCNDSRRGGPTAQMTFGTVGRPPVVPRGTGRAFR